MTRQPEFVTPEVFETAKTSLLKKKPGIDTSIASLEDFTEGLCSQVMHIDTYEDEPPALQVVPKSFSYEQKKLSPFDKIVEVSPTALAPRR